MYESPITIVTQKLRKAISEKHDDYIMATVEEALGCKVDKEELIKALNYDRNQYDKGFRDGMVCGSTALTGIFIKDMEMPRSCLECPCSGENANEEDYVCEVNNLRPLTEEDKIVRRPNWCPLIEVLQEEPENAYGDLYVDDSD